MLRETDSNSLISIRDVGFKDNTRVGNTSDMSVVWFCIFHISVSGYPEIVIVNVQAGI